MTARAKRSKPLQFHAPEYKVGIIWAFLRLGPTRRGLCSAAPVYKGFPPVRDSSALYSNICVQIEPGCIIWCRRESQRELQMAVRPGPASWQNLEHSGIFRILLLRSRVRSLLKNGTDVCNIRFNSSSIICCNDYYSTPPPPDQVMFVQKFQRPVLMSWNSDYDLFYSQ